MKSSADWYRILGLILLLGGLVVVLYMSEMSDLAIYLTRYDNQKPLTSHDSMRAGKLLDVMTCSPKYIDWGGIKTPIVDAWTELYSESTDSARLCIVIESRLPFEGELTQNAPAATLVLLPSLKACSFSELGERILYQCEIGDDTSWLIGLRDKDTVHQLVTLTPQEQKSVR